MQKVRIVAALSVAILATIFASPGASAVTVSPAGTISATFPAGGLTIRTPLSNTSCAITFGGAVTSAGSGSITSAVITPNPCAGITYAFLFPWTLGTFELTDGLRGLLWANIGLEANIFGVRCLFSGTIYLLMANGRAGGTFNSVLPPVGTLRGPCGVATVGGTGGRLTPMQTIS